MSAFLEDASGKRFPVQDGVTIGRVAGCTIVLDDAKASRRHARLLVSGTVVEIEDLGSHNGTLLNGKPVQRRVLQPGDEIQIGASVLRFVAGAPAPSPGPEPEELEFGSPEVPAPAPAKQQAAAQDVVEFADEIVEVRARPAAPAVTARSPAEAVRPQAAGAHRVGGVLQFHATRQGPAVLGDDLRQMSTPMRALWTLVALAFALGLGYAVMRFVGR